MVLLLVLAFIVALVGLSLLGRLLKRMKKPATVPGSVRVPATVFPEDYLFSPGHLWLDRESPGRTRIGVDELVASFFYQPDNIHLMKPGDTITIGDTMAILRKGDKELYLTSPVSGTVVQTHSVFADAPETLTIDPYKLGWIYVVKPQRLDRAGEGLRKGKAARQWMTAEMARLREFVLRCRPQPVLQSNTLSDGGRLIEGYIDQMDQAAIEMFEREFLSISRRTG